VGLGSYVPARIVDNAQITAWTGASSTWIADRTGVHHRRYALPGTTTSALAARAVERLLADCGRSRDEIRLLVLATSTPDQPIPATAVRTQHLLGMRHFPAFDVNAVCSGFVYGLGIAQSMLEHVPAGGTALVVGADMYSTVMDRADRRTVSLFGDGAGAALLAEVPEGYGLHTTRLEADGTHQDLLEVVAGGTRESADSVARAAGRHFFRMRGREVRDYVLSNVPRVAAAALDAAGFGVGDIQRVIIHQGNTRLVEALARELGVGMDRVPLTAPRFGNTGAASIPVTLHQAHRDRPLQRGERLLLVAAGGGMTLGATVLTWY
jgi:3-oxoacyl-[acyl-carrier-protein] synthase-3